MLSKRYQQQECWFQPFSLSRHSSIIQQVDTRLGNLSEKHVFLIAFDDRIFTLFRFSLQRTMSFVPHNLNKHFMSCLIGQWTKRTPFTKFVMNEYIQFTYYVCSHYTVMTTRIRYNVIAYRIIDLQSYKSVL